LNTETNNAEQPDSFSGIDEALAFFSDKEEGTEEPEVSENEETEGLEEEVAEDVENEGEELDETEDEDEEDDSEEDSEDDEQLEAKFTPFTVGEGDDAVTVDSIEAATAGFMRQKDYTVKTTALKKETEKISEITDGLLNSKKEYIEGLGLLRASMDENLKNFVGVDWVSLEKDDPYAFEEQKNAFDAARLQYSQVLEQEKEQAAAYQEELTQQQAFLREKALDGLVEMRPELAENDHFEKAAQYMVDNYGLSMEEIVGANSPGLWAAMVDLAGKKPARKTKSRIKTIKPKGSSPTTKQQRNDQKRKAVLTAGQSIDEATALAALGIRR
jgi:hypothetical protein